MWWRKQPTNYLTQHLENARKNAPIARDEANRLDELALFLSKELLDRENREARARGRAEDEKYTRERNERLAKEQYRRDQFAE